MYIHVYIYIHFLCNSLVDGEENEYWLDFMSFSIPDKTVWQKLMLLPDFVLKFCWVLINLAKDCIFMIKMNVYKLCYWKRGVHSLHSHPHSHSPSFSLPAPIPQWPQGMLLFFLCVCVCEIHFSSVILSYKTWLYVYDGCFCLSGCLDQLAFHILVSSWVDFQGLD